MEFMAPRLDKDRLLEALKPNNSVCSGVATGGTASILLGGGSLCPTSLRADFVSSSLGSQPQQHAPLTNVYATKTVLSLPQFPNLQQQQQQQQQTEVSHHRDKETPIQSPSTTMMMFMMPPKPVCSKDAQDIAKEALRLTKETLRGEESTYDSAMRHLPTAKDVPNPMALLEPPAGGNGGLRLNKFVRRLHDMLLCEKGSGIVQWRRGLLVLRNTEAFSKQVLPKYFNTRNFKTFRRQLNYYGFVHVRSFSSMGCSAATTTALWVNRELAQSVGDPDDISSVLLLKRVEPSESAKTAEGRRVRKELAQIAVGEDLGVLTSKSLQIQQIRSMPFSAAEDQSQQQQALNTAQEYRGHKTLRIQQIRSVPVSAEEKSREQQQQGLKIVLDHHDHKASNPSMILPSGDCVPLEVHCHSQRAVSSMSNDEEPNRQPSSNASAANLLLLLSKA